MRGKSGRARAAIGMVVALVTALGFPAVASGGAGGAQPSRAEVDAAVAFRAKLGLRADRSFVASTFGSAAYTTTGWAVPLDAGERAEVGRRASLQRAAAPALAAWAGRGDSAGAYVDQAAGGVIVFLTTGDPARARRALEGVLPREARASDVRFERARRSMAALLDVQARIDADVAAGAITGLGIQSTAIDVRANAVHVGVSSETDVVRAEIEARYGNGVEVRAEAPSQGGDACLSRKDCPPAKGGIEIRSAYNGANCTAGLLVQVVGSPEARILTAGHCIGRTGGTGTSRTWTHGGSTIGWSELSTWTDGADADAGLLNPTTGAVDGDRDLAFRAAPTDIVPVSGWEQTAAQLQGGLVCRAGVKSGYHCGTIRLTNRTKAVDGRTIDHQWVVDYDACPGDSGGPYLLDTVAYGIHSDSTYGCDPSTNEAWYSPIGWVLDVLAKRGHPVELCTNADCGSETNTWTRRGDLGQATFDGQLIELEDGRVLSVGGYGSEPWGPAADGSPAPPPQLFDPASGTWSDTATAPWAPAECVGQLAVRLGDGRVLVGGGRLLSGPHGACDSAFVFDPAAAPDRSWSPAAAPPVEIEAAGAVLLADGRAFVAGGAGDDGVTPVALAYEPVADEWATLTPAPTGALGPLVLRLRDGRVLVTGGRVRADSSSGWEDVTATSLYDPIGDRWTQTSPVGADGIAGIALPDGRAVIAGGRDLAWDGAQRSTLLGAVSLFDPEAGTWAKLASLPSPRADLALVRLRSGQLLVAGGLAPGPDGSSVASATTSVFEWSTRKWYGGPSLRTARAGHAGIALADGRVLMAGGGTPSTETTIPGDVLPPSASAPSMALRSGARMSSSAVPIRLAWSATDMGVSGVGTYDVARSTDGGAFTTVATRVTTTTWDTTVPGGHVYRFQVRPRDWAGNVGGWKAGATMRLRVAQESSSAVRYAGTWRTSTDGSYDAAHARYARVAGASATFSFTGRGVSFVATKASNRGRARIYIDGSLVTTVNLYSATRTYRNVVFHRTWSSQGSHRIRIVVVGTYGHPIVDVDAFVVLASP